MKGTVEPLQSRRSSREERERTIVGGGGTLPRKLMKQNEGVVKKKGKCVVLWRQPVSKKVIKWLGVKGKVRRKMMCRGGQEYFRHEKINKMLDRFKKTTTINTIILF